MSKVVDDVKIKNSVKESVKDEIEEKEKEEEKENEEKKEEKENEEKKEEKDEEEKEVEEKEEEKDFKDEQDNEKDIKDEEKVNKVLESSKGEKKVKENNVKKIKDKFKQELKNLGIDEDSDTSFVKDIHRKFSSSDEIKVKLGFYEKSKDDSIKFIDEVSKIAYYYFIDLFKNIESKIEKKDNLSYHTYNFFSIRKYPNDILTVECGNNYQYISRKEVINERAYDNSNVSVSLERESYTYDQIPTCNDKAEYSYTCVKNTFKLKDYNVNIFHNIIDKSRNSKHYVPKYQINFSLKKNNISVIQDIIQSIVEMYTNFRRNCQDHFIYFSNLINESLNDNFNCEFIKNYDFNDNVIHKISNCHSLNSKDIECFFDIEKPRILNIEDIPYLSDYLFFHKPLGEIYFLFIDSDSNLFYINSTNIVHVENKLSSKRDVSNSIIIGYLSGDIKVSISDKHDLLKYKTTDSSVFMVYDIIILNEKDLTSKSMKERHEILKGIFSSEDKTIGVLPYKIPELYYCDCQKENIICTCKKNKNSVSYIIDKLLKQSSNIGENNGILMKHNNYYTNILADKKGFTFPILKYDSFNDIKLKFIVFHSEYTTCSEYNTCYNLYSLGKNGLEMFKGTEKFLLLNETISLDKSKFKLLNNGTLIEVSYDGEKFIPVRICTQELTPISTKNLEKLWNGVLYNKLTDDKLVEYSKFQIGKIDEYNNIENVSENINIKILLYYLLLTGKNTNTVNNINRVIKNDSDCKLAIGNILTSLYQSEIIDE